ncbi:MAG: hypothetical protein FWC97_09060, partial [Treponema sp.]|nr:hypothetical protein [Treponema sp.]
SERKIKTESKRITKGEGWGGGGGRIIINVLYFERFHIIFLYKLQITNVCNKSQYKILLLL